jgi:hypothetical protein
MQSALDVIPVYPVEAAQPLEEEVCEYKNKIAKYPQLFKPSDVLHSPSPSHKSPT